MQGEHRRYIPDRYEPVIAQALLNMVLPPKSYRILNTEGEDITDSIKAQAVQVNREFESWLTWLRKTQSQSQI